MKIILFDTAGRNNLFPLILNKAAADLRIGILTQKERWQILAQSEVFIYTPEYLQSLYSPIIPGEYLLIDASVIVNINLVKNILSLRQGEKIENETGLVACRCQLNSLTEIEYLISSSTNNKLSGLGVKRLTSPHHIFLWNDEMIRFDFDLLTNRNTSQPLDKSVQVINPENIFIEEGAQLNHCIINAQTGPVYIGRNATIMEGCAIRGPFAMCEGAVLKMGTKVYGATTIGPYCTAGGEIKNSILSGYSNKAHDGYLGDSVIGEWCNLGAGTTNSNVKNTGSEVGLYNYPTRKYLSAGNKCGVIMGDYSRTAINTSINTGTVMGLSCNVFGNGLTPKFIPDFSWGFNECNTFIFDKALRDINNWKEMKGRKITGEEKSILKYLYEKERLCII